MERGPGSSRHLQLADVVRGAQVRARHRRLREVRQLLRRPGRQGARVVRPDLTRDRDATTGRWCVDTRPRVLWKVRSVLRTTVK